MLINSAFIFILGIFIGSFLGVLIDRLPKNKTILGRSYCEFCKRNLKALDLIPIISFLYLKGRCRYCKKPLSIYYPLVEVVTGLVFVVSYLASQGEVLQGWQVLFNLALSSSLIVIFFADLRYGIIPDKILIFLFSTSLFYQIFLGRADLINHILSGVVSFFSFLFLFAITKGRGMGLGDVKFAPVLGFVLGFPNFVLALYLAFLTGGATSIILILWGRKKLLGDTIAFGPFLSLGTFLALYFSNTIIPKILPFLPNS